MLQVESHARCVCPSRLSFAMRCGKFFPLAGFLIACGSHCAACHASGMVWARARCDDVTFSVRWVVQHPHQVEDFPVCRITKYIALSSCWNHLSMLASYSCPSFGCHITDTALIINPFHLPNISPMWGFWFWQYKSEQLAVRVTWEEYLTDLHYEDVGAHMHAMNLRTFPPA